MSKELKALEQLKYYNTFANDDFDMTNELSTIEKALKIFEVIKKKGVAVGMLQLENVGLQEYNDFIGDKKLYLTQEEYELLKEVLE